MAWTAPMTFTANATLTAAQMNTHVRDNFLETAPAKATTAGSVFVATGANSIEERVPAAAYDSTSVTSTSAGVYADPTTGTLGPSVTVTTGAKAFVHLYCNLSHSGGLGVWMSYDVSGATTSAASDNRAIQLSSTGGQRVGVSILHEGLTAGSNVFTLKYRVSTSGTGSYSERRISVLPL